MQTILICDKNKLKYFKEYIESFSEILNIQMCYDENSYKNYMKMNINNLNIIFLQNILFEIIENKYINFFLINTEQLSRDNIKKELIEISKIYPYLKILDYSLENIRHIPQHIYLPFLKTLHIEWNYPKDFRYDFGFCGSLSNYRLKILNRLRSNGFTINIIEKFGRDRDKEICKCKIMLNIHYDESYQITEIIRCYPFIFNKKLTISEKSEFSNLEPLKNIIIFTAYENFYQTCIDVITKYQEIYDKIFNQKNITELEKINEKNKKYLINLFL